MTGDGWNLTITARNGLLDMVCSTCRSGITLPCDRVAVPGSIGSWVQQHHHVADVSRETTPPVVDPPPTHE